MDFIQATLLTFDVLPKGILPTDMFPSLAGLLKRHWIMKYLDMLQL